MPLGTGRGVECEALCDEGSKQPPHYAKATALREGVDDGDGAAEKQKNSKTRLAAGDGTALLGICSNETKRNAKQINTQINN